MDKYPSIPSYLASNAVRHAVRNLPQSFASGEKGLPNKAAIFSLADYLLHMAVDSRGELVSWMPVSGVLIYQNMRHMVSLGWRFGSIDSETFFFEQEDIYTALKWLMENGYVSSESNGLEKSGKYLPTPKLVQEFAKVLGIAQK